MISVIMLLVKGEGLTGRRPSERLNLDNSKSLSVLFQPAISDRVTVCELKVLDIVLRLPALYPIPLTNN